MTDRFKLEQQILSCWNITTDIDTIKNITSDARTASHLEALRTLYELKFDQLFDTFETLINERKI